MKKAILTATVTLLMLTATAQKLHIKKIIDAMEEEPLYLPSSDIVLANPTKTIGARVSAFIDEKDTNIVIRTLNVSMVNIGSNCVENNELVILFDDDTKITLTSWNKFNCDGNAWFNLEPNEIETLSKLKIKKIKITNGSTYDSFTSAPKEKDKSYFIELMQAAKTKNIKVINK